MAREYFYCYHDYLKKIAKLSDQEVGRLFRSLLEYSAVGETQELTGREAVAFDFISVDIDNQREAYQAKCAANAEKGKLGGRPPKEKKAKKATGFSENPKVSAESQKSQEKEEEKEKKENIFPPPPSGGYWNMQKKPANSAVNAYMEKISATPSTASMRELLDLERELGTEVCLRAIDRALDANKPNWLYIRAVLMAWKDEGIRTVSQLEQQERSRQESRRRKAASGAPGDASGPPDLGDLLNDPSSFGILSNAPPASETNGGDAT